MENETRNRQEGENHVNDCKVKYGERRKEGGKKEDEVRKKKRRTKKRNNAVNIVRRSREREKGRERVRE